MRRRIRFRPFPAVAHSQQARVALLCQSLVPTPGSSPCLSHFPQRLPPGGRSGNVPTQDWMRVGWLPWCCIVIHPTQECPNTFIHSEMDLTLIDMFAPRDAGCHTPQGMCVSSQRQNRIPDRVTGNHDLKAVSPVLHLHEPGIALALTANTLQEITAGSGESLGAVTS